MRGDALESGRAGGGGEIGRGIVEYAGQRPRRPEELPGVGHAEPQAEHRARSLAPRVQDLEHRRHRDEDSREQDRHLDDRPKREGVALAVLA